MTRRFISEQIEPVAGAIDGVAMQHGEPGLPRRFRWGARTIEVAELLRSWKETATDRGESYVRKHWYELRSMAGQRLRVYFERQRRRGSGRDTPRWWLFWIEDGSG